MEIIFLVINAFFGLLHIFPGILQSLGQNTFLFDKLVIFNFQNPNFSLQLSFSFLGSFEHSLGPGGLLDVG